MTTYGWGLNFGGLLGVGNTTTPHRTPQVVAGGVDFIIGSARSGALAGTLFIGTDRQVYYAGPNTNGNFGDGTAASGATRSTPTLVPGLSNIVKVSSAVSCQALDGTGELWGWGSNQFGVLAQGTTGGNQLTPVSMATGVADFDSDGYSAIILKTGGAVQTVGYGGNGRLATGGTGDQNTWQTVTPTGTVLQVVFGTGCVLARRADGSVLAAGINSGTADKAGQLGVTATADNTTFFALSYTDAIACWAGDFTTFVQKSDSTIWGMGRNELGQLGTGSVSGGQLSPHVSTPTQWAVPSSWAGAGTTILQLPLFSSISIAFSILGTDEQVWTWGGGVQGQMGNGGSTAGNPTTISVNGLTGMKWVASGGASMWAGNAVVVAAATPSFVSIVG